MKLFSDYRKKRSVLQSERSTLEKQKLDTSIVLQPSFLCYSFQGERLEELLKLILSPGWM